MFVNNVNIWKLLLTSKNRNTFQRHGDGGLVVKLSPTLFNPIDCSLPGFSIHGISQARILKWVTISFSKGSSRSRDQTCVSSIGRQVFYHRATREVLPKDTVFFLRHHWGQTGRHPGGAEFPEGSYCSSYCQEVQPQASLGPGWVSEQGTGSHIQSLGSFSTDASYLWCWRRLLRVLWTVWSNKSILKEVNPEYSLEGLMLKLKSQYFVHLTWRDNSFEKILMLGKTEGRRRRGQQRMRLLNGTTDSMDVNLSKLREVVKDRATWHAAVLGISKS